MNLLHLAYIDHKTCVFMTIYGHVSVSLSAQMEIGATLSTHAFNPTDLIPYMEAFM